MDNNIFIRQAGSADRDIIVDIGRNTFGETYSEVSNNGAIENYVQKRFSEEAITAELNNPNATFYIGFSENTPVAFTKLRNDRKPKGLKQQYALEIEGIYVLTEYQGLKVGREMLDKCKEVAVSARYDVIWLQVWQRNDKAIQFYQKSGFVIYETTVFSYFGKMTQEDYLMRFNVYY